LVEPGHLPDLLLRKGLTRVDKLLLCMATNQGAAKRVREIKDIAKTAGLRAAGVWNVSAVLARSGGLAVNAKDGWVLNGAGRDRVAEIVGTEKTRPTSGASRALRDELAKIKSPDARAFVEEAIQCLEHRLYRAAVVLSWVGAMAVLHEYVVSHRLADFNAEALRRDAKWKPARTTGDLTRMKEYDFLQVAAAISIIDKNVKQRLEQCLDLRNGCGHPSSLQVAENGVAAHIEALILNVFSKF